MPEQQQQTPAAPESTRTMHVQLTDQTRTFWDRHPDHEQAGHEDGDVLITEDLTAQVADTPGVRDAIAKGRLREVSAPAGPRPLPSEGPPAQPAEGGDAPQEKTKAQQRGG
jgi:hypothetical protein